MTRVSRDNNPTHIITHTHIGSRDIRHPLFGPFPRVNAAPTRREGEAVQLVQGVTCCKALTPCCCCRAACSGPPLLLRLLLYLQSIIPTIRCCKQSLPNCTPSTLLSSSAASSSSQILLPALESMIFTNERAWSRSKWSIVPARGDA